MVLPLGDTVRTQTVPLVTYALIAVNVMVYVVSRAALLASATFTFVTALADAGAARGPPSIEAMTSAAVPTPRRRRLPAGPVRPDNRCKILDLMPLPFLSATRSDRVTLFASLSCWQPSGSACIH